ncbi:MAG: diguanylate cyclase [Clostridiales Family XIII bacterium]|jgi:diguanylate cyclase (GGDEF)-like protein|nr:diguanylate cyclase [Clostridiales Family XIII bacterium]
MGDILYAPRQAHLEPAEFSDELKDFAEGLTVLGRMVNETRTLAGQLSRGELDIALPDHDNELAAPLKALHATLKHLAWQTKQVARGDYSQHINFMGEFADAFNDMIGQLATQRERLQAEMDLVKRRAEDLERSSSLFEAISGSMPEWIVMVDKETGEHLFVNHPPESVLASDIFEKQLYEILLEYAQPMEIGDEPRTESFSLISDVALQYFELRLYPIMWYSHEAVACVLTDVTKEFEEHSRLEDVAYRDTQTGVYNRHFGMQQLGEWIGAEREFFLVFVDMDMLKYVNDVFGHGEGDIYIKTVADLLAGVSGAAIVSRLGGDEFMLLWDKKDADGRDLGAVTQLFEDLRDKLAASSSVDEKGEVRYARSMSLGIVDVGADNRLSSSDLLSLADERMYEYKRAHKMERRI